MTTWRNGLSKTVEPICRPETSVRCSPRCGTDGARSFGHYRAPLRCEGAEERTAGASSWIELGREPGAMLIPQ